MKLIAIYKIDMEYIFFPYSLTVRKRPVPSPPFTHIGINESHEVLTKCFLETFKAIGYDIPDVEPSERKLIEKRLLDGLGVKSLLQLHKTAAYCSATLKDNSIVITPTINRVSDKMFSFINGKSITVSENASAGELSKALNDAFDQCE